MIRPVELGTSAENASGYAREWRRFAVRYYLAFFMLWGWVPACLGLFVLSRRWIHQPEICLAGMVLWFGAALAAVWWAGESRCPRCCRRYAALGHGSRVKLTRGLFDKVCSNCTLAKFEK